MTQSNPRVGMVFLVVLALGLLGAVPAARAQEAPRYSIGLLGQFTPQGMLVQVVQPGSEAARAGLQKGDLITKVDGTTITNQTDFVQVINSSGGSVVLSVRKASTGKMARVELNLNGGARPGGVKAPYLLGVAGQYRPEGMLIKTVGAGTPASRAGLAEDDLILRINNEVIRNQRDLFTVLYNSGGEVVLDVRKKGGRVIRLNVDLRVYELGAIGDFIAQGMRVRIVAPGTAADRLGLQPGDVIVSIDNRALRNQQDFNAALKRSGGSITLVVRKAPDGVPVRLQAELINNPLGVWCETSTDGVRITHVPVSTPAEGIGLERGDIIVKIDNQRVRTNRELTAALKDSGGVANVYVRKRATDRLVRLEVILGW